MSRGNLESKLEKYDVRRATLRYEVMGERRIQLTALGKSTA